MSDDESIHAIRILACSMRDLQRRAAEEYASIVVEILRTRSRDPQRIEHALDGMLDFCGHEPVLQLYKRLCRYYWDIDPAATAFYVKAYREYWDSDEPGG